MTYIKTQSELKERIFYKNMGIYLLHRSNELDHEKGRPAILLKYRTKSSLIWWGTHKIDNKTKEKPLVITVNNVKTYFYAKGIEKVASYSLKKPWVDFSHKNKTNEAKEYELTNLEQQKLIAKFASFTFEQDPYLQNKKLEQDINNLIIWNKNLQEENAKLKIKLKNQDKELWKKEVNNSNKKKHEHER